jgi:amino acid adenylation domain-containing protein
MTRHSPGRTHSRATDERPSEGVSGSPSTVPEWVAAQAARSPEALAVTAGGGGLTYGELESSAASLARRLRSLGVGPDVVVGLCLKSSPAMVVGALGIMKAGGAYLPLDPAWPKDRLAALLSDAKPPVIVAAACQEERVPRGAWALVTLDAEGAHTGPSCKEAAPQGVSPEGLAYVIYTSGSTGQPKGVEITHANLLNLVRWHHRAFAVTSSDRASQIASVGFDAAVWEVWPYLTKGASVHVPDEAVRNDPEALRDWLVSEGITLTFVATPLAERMITLQWPAGAALRAMLTGADALRHHPSPGLPFVLVNNYGPTECTVVATSGTIDPDEGSDALPSIGVPIDGTEIFILDEHLLEVPPGSSGELHIGGAGLARGYLKRPDLTREKFIPSPFGKEPGSRLYKTGDLARRLPDGRIAFLGRIDEQVKIRGYRIEPAEIAKALDSHPAVQQSVVVASEFAPGDRRLVAYFVPGTERHPSSGELRDFLGASLPDFMVPARFVALKALPLNSSGKVDRAALPKPEPSIAPGDEAPLAPRTPVEERVAAVVAPLLGLDRVGVLDNFFMLGGHSMLGTQLITRLREIYSVELALRSLFDAPTVAGLSAEIERLLHERLEAMSEAEAERMLQEPQGAGSGLFS